MDILTCCCGTCISFILGATCGVLCCDEKKKETPETANAPPYPSQNPVTTQPTMMPVPVPNPNLGWNMIRNQDRPYPELNSDCPYPPLLPNPPQHVANSSSPPYPVNNSQPSAPYPTNNSSQEAQDCPPDYNEVIHSIRS